MRGLLLTVVFVGSIASASADCATPYANAPNWIVCGVDNSAYSDGCGDAGTCEFSAGEKKPVGFVRWGILTRSDYGKPKVKCEITRKHTAKDGLTITSKCK